MKRLVLALALILAVVEPATAHRLKLFATVEDGAITGYAFFIGGGRPEGSTIVIRDAQGIEVHRTATDAEGRFAWTPPAPGAFTVTVDAMDGHMAEARLDAQRFGAVVDAAVPAAPAPPGNAVSTGTPPAPADTAMIERAVDRAVERQLRPLLEAYDAAEGRVRFNDVVSGIGMIVGLAGIGLWASSRRKSK
ncbi:MAG: carboxypeptidase-like regulatory domain-containing protein [Zavarzinia sp.]|nr:carboxypeptidase-like regulatory domain-containing protein [Zavarzinia sp.]